MQTIVIKNRSMIASIKGKGGDRREEVDFGKLRGDGYVHHVAASGGKGKSLTPKKGPDTDFEKERVDSEQDMSPW